jgi:hypothetical protein
MDLRGSIPDLAQVRSTSPMLLTTMQPAPCSIPVISVVKRVITSFIIRYSPSKPMTEVAGVTFLFYEESQGGPPLWVKKQSAHPNKTGDCSVGAGFVEQPGLLKTSSHRMKRAGSAYKLPGHQSRMVRKGSRAGDRTEINCTASLQLLVRIKL